jgi:anti-anti-sigma factor
MSSAGLRVLLIGYKVADRDGSELILRNVSTSIRDILNMTGFAKLFTIE